MSENTLPPVAKSFYHYCKKCEANRYQRVLTHTGPDSAKLECEVCHSKSTFKLEKPGAVRKTVVKAGGVARPAASRRSTHASEYELLLDQHSEAQAIPFSIKTKFEANQKLNHPKFGIGIIRSASGEKIEVVFSDEIKFLVHNRV